MFSSVNKLKRSTLFSIPLILSSFQFLLFFENHFFGNVRKLVFVVFVIRIFFVVGLFLFF